MSGGSFITKGTAGTTIQTVWFSPIVDRLNMLAGSQYPTSPYNTSIAPAHYGNLWFPTRSSFTGFTTAPDGTTNTAQFLAEDTSNNTHFIQAGSIPQDNNITGALNPGYALGRIRFAGYFKSSTRRIGYTIQTFDGGGNNSGKLTVVFDLVGGQVGVAASVSGLTGNAIITPAGTTITQAANGFQLCIQDLYLKDGNFALLVATCFLDNGTGTGALSNSYTGDGASGVYCWRTNLMPAAAWGINNNIFFDDFLSSSTIDLNNTKAPGFNWYPSAGVWTNYINDTGSPYPSGDFSVSGSILTISAKGGGGFGSAGTMLGTAAQISDVGGTYVGQGFGGGRPMLIEGSLTWAYATQETTTAVATLWSSNLEWIVAQGQGQAAALASQPKFPGREFDLVQGAGVPSTVSENVPNLQTIAYIGVSGAFGLPGNGGTKALGQNLGSMNGFPPWESTYDYGTTFFPGREAFVMQGTQLYQCANQSHNTNNMPPNATFWGTISTSQKQIQSDPAQYHLYSNLIIPYWGQPGISTGMAQQSTFTSGGPISGAVQDPALGVRISFYDGLWCNTSGFWGPNVSFNFPNGDFGSYLWSADNGHLALWMSAGKAQSMSVDYIRVMQ